MGIEIVLSCSNVGEGCWEGGGGGYKNTHLIPVERKPAQFLITLENLHGGVAGGEGGVGFW